MSLKCRSLLLAALWVSATLPTPRLLGAAQLASPSQKDREAPDDSEGTDLGRENLRRPRAADPGRNLLGSMYLLRSLLNADENLDEALADACRQSDHVDHTARRQGGHRHQGQG